MTMTRLERLLAYAAQNYGDTPETRQRVMDAVLNGTEAALLTRNQRRRDRQKQHLPPGSHRQSQRARRAEAARRREDRA